MLPGGVYLASLLLHSYRSPRPALRTALRARGFSVCRSRGCRTRVRQEAQPEPRCVARQPL